MENSKYALEWLKYSKRNSKPCQFTMTLNVKPKLSKLQENVNLSFLIKIFLKTQIDSKWKTDISIVSLFKVRKIIVY
jgi:hypothetical protein